MTFTSSEKGSNLGYLNNLQPLQLKLVSSQVSVITDCETSLLPHFR